ncbi:MAG: hypothetical protein WBH44_11295 [Proteocatella sp.]
MMFLVVIIIGVIVYYGFKGDSSLPNANRNQAEDILKRRYVTGEIDEKTYLQMREILKK